MKAGAVEFLTKPVREQTLLDAVRDALERDRVRREQAEKMRDLQARFELLSPRECEVLSLVITGPLNKQIAAEMKLSEVTVKVHRAKLMKKLGAKSLPDLVRIAGALGLFRRHKALIDDGHHLAIGQQALGLYARNGPCASH